MNLTRIVGGVCVMALTQVCSAQLVTVDFDSLDASSGAVVGAALDAYLASHNLTLSGVSSGTQLSIQDDRNIYGGVAVTASSGHNVFLQSGSATLVNYTLSFNVPVSNVSFDRVALVAGPSGITHPWWSATAYTAADASLGTVGEGLIATMANLPAATFQLPYSNIGYIRVSSDAQSFAAFTSVVMDNLSFTAVPEPATGGVLAAGLLLSGGILFRRCRLAQSR